MSRGLTIPMWIPKVPTFKQFLKAFEPMDDKNPMKKSFQEAVTRLPLAKAHKCEVAVCDLFQKNSPSGGRNMQNDGQGVLVLEDLSHDALTKIGGLTRGQMMQIAEAIASLHAYSLTYKDWKHDAINSTMRLMSKGFDEKMTIVERIAACVPQLIEWNTEIFDPLAEKLSELVKTTDDVFYVYDLNKTMFLPDVFCNGDLHVNNMMWFKDKDGNATDKLMALLDWQVCHPGSIGEDFARVFTSSVSADVRRNHYMEILQHYYNCLSQRLGTNPPYTFDKVAEAYHCSFKYGVMMVFQAFPLFVKAPEVAGIDRDEKYKELLERVKALIEDL